jgi:hypothetical protein
MPTHNIYRFVLVGFVFLTAALVASSADAQTAKLRYGFKKGQTYGYDIKVTWTYPDHTVTKKGISLYEGVSADKDGIFFSQQGLFTDESQFKLKPEKFRCGAYQTKHSIRIDSLGEVQDTWSSYTSLAEIMDDFETVVFQRLPKGDEQQWHTENEFEITKSRFGMRLWTDAKGKHQIKAKLLGIKAGNVLLKQEDGKKITIPLEKLSKADQQFVKSQMPSDAGKDEGE